MVSESHPAPDRSPPPRRAPAVAAIVALVLVVGTALAYVYERYLRAEQRSNALQAAEQTARLIDQQISRDLSTTYSLAALVRQGGGAIRDFDAIAGEMLALNPSISALQLAPGGIIQQIVPMAGNEAAVGHNLLTDEKRNREARLAVQTRRLTLAGPFELKQGGRAFIGRLPIFLGPEPGTFWGFATVLTRLPSFLEAVQLDKLAVDGYAYELWRIHPDTQQRDVFARSTGDLPKDPISVAIEVPNGRWNLSVAPHDGWGSSPRLAVELALILVAALLAGWIVFTLQDTRRTLVNTATRLQTLLDTASDGIHIVDWDGNLLEFSQSFCQMLGYTPEETTGLNVADWDAFVPREKLVPAARSLMAARNPGRFQTRHRRKDGSTFDVEVSYIGIEIAETPYLYASSRDISERLSSERAMADSEARFRLLASATFEGIAITEQGVFVDANDQLLAMLGYPREELLGRHIDDLISADDRQRVLINIEYGRESNIQHAMIRKDGRLIDVEAHGQTIEIEGRRVRITALRDITERKRMENELIAHREELERLVAERTAELSASEARFRGLVDQSLAGIDIVQDGYFRYANQAMADILGYDSPAELIDRVLLVDTVAPECRERVEENLRRRQEGEIDAIQYQFTALTRDGRRVDLEVFGRSLEFDGRPATIAIVLDISERLRLEQERAAFIEQLALAKDAAEAADRAKSAFLAGVSHELRTPMHGILGLIAIAKKRVTDPAITDLLEKARQSANRLMGVINDILDFSTIEAGELSIRKKPFELTAVLGKLDSLLRHRATAKGLGFAIEVPEELAGRRLVGDPVRLGQVLANLGGNAIKFSHRGEIVIRAEIREETSETVLLRCAVSDQGVGISAEDQQRLFSAFEQADASMSRHYGGTGLGLAISKRLVPLMGGEIGVDSTLGEGSAFWFTVRLGKAD